MNVDMPMKFQEGPNVLEPYIEENKKEHKIVLSATIVVSSNNIQTWLSGDTPSPSH